MNAMHEFLLAYPLLRTSLDIISVAVPLSVLLAFAGMGFMSATARVLPSPGGAPLTTNAPASLPCSA